MINPNFYQQIVAEYALMMRDRKIWERMPDDAGILLK